MEEQAAAAARKVGEYIPMLLLFGLLRQLSLRATGLKETQFSPSAFFTKQVYYIGQIYKFQLLYKITG